MILLIFLLLKWIFFKILVLFNFHVHIIKNIHYCFVFLFIFDFDKIILKQILNLFSRFNKIIRIMFFIIINHIFIDFFRNLACFNVCFKLITWNRFEYFIKYSTFYQILILIVSIVCINIVLSPLFVIEFTAKYFFILIFIKYCTMRFRNS